jgi:multimeric flavodoxin WrbA
MKLAVFNGSPRGKDSNTKVLLTQFLNGFMSTDGNSYELSYLIHSKEHSRDIEFFRGADLAIIAFPLYFDSMPANVKAFMEALEPLSHRSENPAIGFIVQSGFPEPGHSRYVERYLQKFAERMSCEYKGTVIRGAFEAIRIPPLLNKMLHKFIIAIGKAVNKGGMGGISDVKRLNEKFYKLGVTFGETGVLDKDIIYQLAQPEKLSKVDFWLYKSIGESFYWNNLLKKNNAYNNRFDRPYAH